MRTRTFVRSALSVATLLALTGCDWGRFSDLEDNAPVLVIEKPDDYSSGHFGDVLTAYARVVDGEVLTRLAVSAGTGTPTNVYPIFNGETFSTNPLFDTCKTVGVTNACGNSAGSALAGAPAIGTGQSCIIVGARVEHKLVYRCEAGGAMGGGEGVNVPFDATEGTVPAADSNFGAALAPVPFGTTVMHGAEPVRAFVGAPGLLEPTPPTSESRGNLYLFHISGSGNVTQSIFASDIQDHLTSDTLKGLGRQLVSAPYDSTHTLLLASANSRVQGGPQRLAVFLVDNATAATELRGCIARTNAPITVFTAGDFNGDGIGDIAVSDDGGSPLRTPTVDVYDGRGLPGSSTGNCQAWDSTASTLACPTVGDTSCEGSGFGAALTAADLNEDGMDELVVSAPFAATGGITGAGVAYVYAGGSSGAGSLAPTLLRNSDPNANGNFGRNLITFPISTTRSELIVAEGGGNDPALYIFLCSGIDDDRANPMSPRCQMMPVTP